MSFWKKLFGRHSSQDERSDSIRATQADKIPDSESPALGKDINIVDAKEGKGEGSTTLHHVAALGQTKRIRELLQKGADVNALDNSGKTPLDHAVGHHKAEYVLRKAGGKKAKELFQTESSGGVRVTEQPNSSPATEGKSTLPLILSSSPVSADTATVFASSLRRHLEKVRAEGGPISEFINHYLNEDIVSEMARHASERMHQSQADGEVHSRAIIESPVFYNIWAFPFEFEEAVRWFGHRAESYSRSLMTKLDSELFQIKEWQVLVDIAFSRSGCVAVTILSARGSSFDIGPVFTLDLLSDDEKRDLQAIRAYPRM